MSEERTPRMASILGEKSVVIGNIDGNSDLEIRGRVQGSITLQGRVLIAETGVVLGSIEANHITVCGEIRGDLNAPDGVEVQALGKVEGNIEAPRVGIEAGARVRGMLRTGGELPAALSDDKPEPKKARKAAEPDMAAPPAKVESKAEAPKKEGPRRLRKTEGRRSEGSRGEGPKGPARPARKKPARTRSSENPALAQAKEEKPKPQEPSAPKKRSRKGPPAPPTFVKGAKGKSR